MFGSCGYEEKGVSVTSNYIGHCGNDLTILAIYDVIDGIPENSLPLLVMKILSAVVWTIIFAMYLHRYRTGKKV